MLSFRKFALERFDLYMNEKYGDVRRVPENQYAKEFDKWQEENFTELNLSDKLY